MVIISYGSTIPFTKKYYGLYKNSNCVIEFRVKN